MTTTSIPPFRNTLITAAVLRAQGHPAAESLRDFHIHSLAALNGWEVWAGTFAMHGLDVGKLNAKGWGAVGEVPGADHEVFFVRNGRPVALMVEPYGGLDKLADYAALHSLTLHTPPNPRASFWAPGGTSCGVFTRPGVGVRWLQDQLEFAFRRDSDIDAVLTLIAAQ